MNDFSTAALPPCGKNGIGYLWTEEDDRLLRELWPGHSAGVIATRLFPRRSRSAVIGRVHRLKLTPKKPEKGTLERKLRKKPKPYVRATRYLSCGDKIPQPIPEILTEPQGWEPIGVPLLEAGTQHCRAIIESSAAAGPGNAICCGHPVPYGQALSFCGYHMELFTEPPGRRRGRRNWRHWRHSRR